MSGIPLAEVIADLRDELARAMEEGEKHDVRFKPGPIEVELALEVRKEGSGRAGIKFWVVELGGDIKAANVQSHKIKLSRQLVDRAGQDLLIRSDVKGRPGG
jgi:hypothetical protein